MCPKQSVNAIVEYLSRSVVEALNHFIYFFWAHLLKISSLREVPPLFASEIELRPAATSSMGVFAQTAESVYSRVI